MNQIICGVCHKPYADSPPDIRPPYRDGAMHGMCAECLARMAKFQLARERGERMPFSPTCVRCGARRSSEKDGASHMIHDATGLCYDCANNTPASRRRWCVRVACPAGKLTPHPFGAMCGQVRLLLHALHDACVVYVHRHDGDGEGALFDINAPATVADGSPTHAWSLRVSELMSEAGFNAVPAPEWPTEARRTSGG